MPNIDPKRVRKLGIKKKTLDVPGPPIPDGALASRVFGGEASDGVGDVPKRFQLLYLIILRPIQPTKRCPKSDLLALPFVAPT